MHQALGLNVALGQILNHLAQVIFPQSHILAADEVLDSRVFRDGK